MTRSEKLLRELIALPSVNPAFLPAGHPHAGEQRVADFLAASAARAGLDVEFQSVAPQRNNLIVRLSPRKPPRRRIYLAPHLDTVNGIDEQFIPNTRNGRLYGRGACDTKGSVAAMFTALASIAQRGPRPAETEIFFLGLLDEEKAQAGSRAFASEPGRFRGPEEARLRAPSTSASPAELAIVGEPTGAKVVTAHKGSIWLQVETCGRAAHGAQPEAGRNAVHLMARIVDFLQTDYAAGLGRRRHSLLGIPTVSVGTICGGTQPNIVPDRCTITVDRRTLPGETEPDVLRELQRLLNQKGLAGAVSSSKEAECLPLETDPHLPLVRDLFRAAGQRRPRGAIYFCDASVLAHRGIPSVVFGPGDIAQAHTSDEWLSLDSLERATAVLTRFLQALP